MAMLTACLSPASDGNTRPLSWSRDDLELVRQPLGAAQPQPQAAAAGVGVLERERQVLDAGPLVLEGEPKTEAPAVGDGLQAHRAAAAVIDRVARQLTGRRHHLRLIYQA